MASDGRVLTVAWLIFNVPLGEWCNMQDAYSQSAVLTTERGPLFGVGFIGDRDVARRKAGVRTLAVLHPGQSRYSPQRGALQQVWRSRAPWLAPQREATFSVGHSVGAPWRRTYGSPDRGGECCRIDALGWNCGLRSKRPAPLERSGGTAELANRAGAE